MAKFKLVTDGPEIQLHILAVRLNPEIHEKLNQAARKNSISKQQLVNQMLSHCLKEMEQ